MSSFVEAYFLTLLPPSYTSWQHGASSRLTSKARELYIGFAMSAAWLTYPLQLEGSRAFECDELTTEECDYYMHRWHFWYLTMSHTSVWAQLIRLRQVHS